MGPQNIHPPPPSPGKCLLARNGGGAYIISPWILNHINMFQPFLSDAAFLLPVGSFPLTVELFYSQLTILALLLRVGAFLLTILVFWITVGALLLTVGKCV